ncbi:hypothetical protein Tco_1051771, partial [Tanacetum coccineum]
RKPAKSEPTVHKDPAFDDLDDIVDDAMDYMETVEPQDEGRTSSVVLEEKEISTAKPKEVEVSTDKLDEGTAEPKDGTSDENTAPTTVFRDDETIAEFLISMSQNKAKQKGVEIKDAEDSDRPRAISTRSDEEIARKVQEDWEAEEEMKKLSEEEATKAALIQDFDDIQAIIEADRLLAARLQEEERETFTVEKRAKFLYGTKKRKSGHVKMIARKRPRPQPDDDSDDEHRKCLRIVTFDSTLDSEIMETKSFVSKLHKVSSPDGDYLVVYRVNGHFSLLVERRYPLSKELLQRMIDLGLEVKEESTAALHLVRYIKQQLNEE